MDTPKKPQASEEEQEVLGPPRPAPSPPVQARSPFRPLSLRRRRAQVAETPSAVERPSTSLVFDASPTTVAAAVAAALAKAGGSPEQSLAWRAGQDSDPDVTVEISADEDDEATGSPR